MEKKNLALLVLGVIAVGSLTFSAVVTNNNATSQAEMERRIAELENKKETLDAAFESEQQGLVENVSGMSTTRVERDTKEAAKLFTIASDFKDSQSYIESRNHLMKTYNIDASSSFMQVFMPEIKPFPTESGEEKYEIDVKGINAEYEGISPYVTGIVGDEYTYFSEVTIRTTTKDGYSTSADFVAIYTINSDGDITNLNAYTTGDF